MPEVPYLSLILPAFNEVRSIGNTLTAMPAYLDRMAHSYEIIVSADGADGTRELVAERARHDYRLSVLGTPERAARGAASGWPWRRPDRWLSGRGLQGRHRRAGEGPALVRPGLRHRDRLAHPWATSPYEVAQPLHRRLGSKCFGVVMHPPPDRPVAHPRHAMRVQVLSRRRGSRPLQPAADRRLHVRRRSPVAGGAAAAIASRKSASPRETTAIAGSAYFPATGGT